MTTDERQHDVAQGDDVSPLGLREPQPIDEQQRLADLRRQRAEFILHNGHGDSHNRKPGRARAKKAASNRSSRRRRRQTARGWDLEWAR